MPNIYDFGTKGYNPLNINYENKYIADPKFMFGVPSLPNGIKYSTNFVPNAKFMFNDSSLNPLRMNYKSPFIPNAKFMFGNNFKIDETIKPMYVYPDEDNDPTPTVDEYNGPEIKINKNPTLNWNGLEGDPMNQNWNPRNIKKEKRESNYIPFLTKKERQQIRADKRDTRQEARQETQQEKREQKSYNRNVLYNKIGSLLRNYSVGDSIDQYYDKKRNTPDMSAIENAKNYALNPTHVIKSNPTHIQANYKYTPYDFMQTANLMNAQTANGINAINRVNRGNLNATIKAVNNLNSNAQTNIGDGVLKQWQNNEAARHEAAKLNLEAYRFNQEADNRADENYVNSRNSAAISDKSTAYNALNSYAQSKYNMQHTYENELKNMRDEMASNLTDYGKEAYDTNKTNTDKQYNYWYDPFGIQHQISQQDGVRYVEQPKTAEENYEYDVQNQNKAYSLADDTTKSELSKLISKFGNRRGAYEWMRLYGNDLIKNNTKTV